MDAIVVLEKINKEWSAMGINQDAASIAQLYHKNAVIEIDENPPIIGQTNILADYKRMLKDEPILFNFQTSKVWMNNSQQMVEEGLAIFKNRQNQVLEKSQYITFWQKVDGQWKIYRDVITTLPMEFDLAAAKAEIEAKNVSFMALAKAKNVDGLIERYTDDAQFLAPNFPAMVGKPQIKALLTGLTGAVDELILELIDLQGDENMLVEVGLYTTKMNTGTIVDKGKYTLVWKKVDGDWLIFRDMINTNMPLVVETSNGLTTDSVIGDTLHYVVGDAVFDIVMPTDSTLYWKSFNPKYGKEAYEKITIIPISEHENMVSYIEKGNVGVCWYNDFKNEKATVSVFVGENLMTFSGTVKLKYVKKTVGSD